jgi:hypothetical protein
MSEEEFKKLMLITERVKVSHRDIQIEKILRDNDEYKTPDERFIDEVKDHLSTCINRNEYKDWFIIDISEVPTCNCKVHIEEEFSLLSFLHTIYSLYRKEEEFNIYNILTNDVITKITIKQ